MAETKGVLIVAEVQEGKLSSISAELLGVGKKLAGELGQDLAAVVIGSGVGDAAKEAVSFGADKVYVIDNPMFADYVNDA
ncbi:MAG: electron transfer flavoprotein subunit alpha, partial [Chloroflexota bacterium]|nr:electron transfer flavoprotein subunit alpha [Chloroflexota bacterium]